MSDRPLSEEMQATHDYHKRTRGREEGEVFVHVSEWQIVFWIDRAAALEDALATIWAALDVDTMLAIEAEFDEAALQARKAFYAAQGGAET